MEILSIKLTSIAISICFLGFLGSFWTADNTANKIAKFLVFAAFFLGVYDFIQCIKLQQITSISYSISLFSAGLGAFFMFRKTKGNHWIINLFKFLCIVSVVSTITLISI